MLLNFQKHTAVSFSDSHDKPVNQNDSIYNEQADRRTPEYVTDILAAERHVYKNRNEYVPVNNCLPALSAVIQQIAVHENQGNGSAYYRRRGNQNQLYSPQHRVQAGLEFHTAKLRSPRDQTDPGHSGAGKHRQQGMAEFMMYSSDECQVIS